MLNVKAPDQEHGACPSSKWPARQENRFALKPVPVSCLRMDPTIQKKGFCWTFWWNIRPFEIQTVTRKISSN